MLVYASVAVGGTKSNKGSSRPTSMMMTSSMGRGFNAPTQQESQKYLYHRYFLVTRYY